LKIALGTDWIPTGSMNMQRELKCADDFNRVYLNGFFDDRELWRMVTIYAAEVLAMDDAIGSLEPGLVADIAIFDGSANADYRALIDAQPQDVTLVIRGGKVLYGDDALVTELAVGNCDALEVCSVAKRVCVESEIGMTLAALAADVGTQYALFFCGTPDNEPSCHPERPVSVNGSTVYDGVPTASDTDGDGIDDASDNCPDVFNPIRPLDDGAQADFDNDGVGDVCDPCPIDPNTTNCSTPDPDDVDGDGEPNATDNCPNTPNADQADGDNDGRGDVCDDCPTTYNPAPLACPATIYDIKQGNVTGEVAVLNALVTGCSDGNGFFVQVKPGDADYAGVDHSGLYTYSPGVVCGTDLSVGDRVDINPATVSDYYGQIQLGFTSFNVTSSGETLPAPEVVTPAQAGGTSPTALESVLVRVENVQVTELDPPAGPGDSNPNNEFVVDSALRVNDLIYLTTPMPTVGSVYLSITGILNYRNGNSKLEPRDATDLVEGAPILYGFDPPLVYVEVGGSTLPSALTVLLSGPAQGDTIVDITSSDPTALSVPATVTVPDGQTSVVVPLTGNVAQVALVQVTASLDSIDLIADVSVYDDSLQREVVDVLPATVTIAISTATDLEVFLNIPAPTGGSTVNLSTSGGIGSVPATVLVPAGQLSALFTFTAGATAGSETITATLGTSSDFATVDVVAHHRPHGLRPGAGQRQQQHGVRPGGPRRRHPGRWRVPGHRHRDASGHRARGRADHRLFRGGQQCAERRAGRRGPHRHRGGPASGRPVLRGLGDGRHRDGGRGHPELRGGHRGHGRGQQLHRGLAVPPAQRRRHGRRRHGLGLHDHPHAGRGKRPVAVKRDSRGTGGGRGGCTATPPGHGINRRCRAYRGRPDCRPRRPPAGRRGWTRSATASRRHG
jgi:hypothetical protein